MVELTGMLGIIIQSLVIEEKEWLDGFNEIIALDTSHGFNIQELTILVEYLHLNTCHVECLDQIFSRMLLQQLEELHVDIWDICSIGSIQREILLLYI